MYFSTFSRGNLNSYFPSEPRVFVSIKISSPVVIITFDNLRTAPECPCENVASVMVPERENVATPLEQLDELT
jgi:hypothetical protein